MANSAIACPICDAPGCTVKAGTRGGYSASCPTCGYQGFMRTPKAADAMRAKLDGAPARLNAHAADDDFMSKL